MSDGLSRAPVVDFSGFAAERPADLYGWRTITAVPIGVVVHLGGLRTFGDRVAVVIVVFCSAIVTVLLTPPAADAVVRTGTGVRCTIIGTMGRDVLTGTPGRDVICGRGGNDVIAGRGGNDLIYGGAGNDSLSGAGGNDVLYGGPGRDSLGGQAGDDRLLGGLDNDRLTGMGGNDVLSGGPGTETITGGAGNDRISGGDGADTVAGEDGNDVVVGDGGDDNLSGGPGGDQVDGGPGFNICDVPGSITDTQVRCAIDTSRPVVGGVSVSPSVVDVSSAAQFIRIRAHVTDDTGVTSVQIGNLASRISGTARDGIWETTLRVPRFTLPGARDLDIFVRDRVGRDTFETRANAFTVVNTVYDKAMPVLRSLTLSTSSVDVRTAAKPVTATIRVTDDLAGPTSLWVCPAHAMPTGQPSFRQAGGCEYMSKLSGTATDSTWRATLTIPKGAPSGTWNVEVWISDAAGNLDNDFWYGPDELAAIGPTNETRDKAIPNGAGVFTVLGSPPDVNAPVLTSLKLTPSTVDTASGAVLVTADIAGTDPEGMTDAGLFISGYAGYPDNQNWIDLVQIAWVDDFQRISGTPQNGVWRATFVVPGGTPDGTYFIQAGLQDSAHWESWVSSDSGWTTDNHLLTDALAPTGTHFVVANSS
jgi:Ca2+-binding RTX toxin-like protein